MNNGKVSQHLDAIREAFATFLTTLLGDERSIDLSAETVSDVATSIAPDGNDIVVAAREADELRGFVVMGSQWLATLSEAVLGSALTPDDEGADDLIQELTGQAYGAVRSRLSGDGVKLPDVAFTVASAQELTDASGDGTVVNFNVTSDDGAALSGAAVIVTPPKPVAKEAPRSMSSAASTMPRVDIAPAAFPELGATTVPSGDGSNFELLAEVELEVTVELGRRRIPLADVLRLTTGSVIELEKLVGEPLEVYANGRLIAEGEAVVIDEQFGVRITNLVSSSKRAKAFI